MYSSIPNVPTEVHFWSGINSCSYSWMWGKVSKVIKKKIFSSIRLWSQYLELFPDWKWGMCWEETGNITVQLPFYSPTDGIKRGIVEGVWNSLKCFSMLKAPLLFQKSSAPTRPWASVVWSEGQGEARDFFCQQQRNQLTYAPAVIFNICLAWSWRGEWSGEVFRLFL